jgi:hypothetical protein
MSTTPRPGPWSVWEDEGQLQIRDERYILLAVVRPCRKHAKANATLIAAAPDMLEALEAIQVVLTPDATHCHRIIADALAKAKGTK